MDFSNCKYLRFFGRSSDSLACKCVVLVIIVLIFRAICVPSYYGFSGSGKPDIFGFLNHQLVSNSDLHIAQSKFLEVPQIVWGLNNQKIAFARACLTARMLNRTLLMPSLSASLFYKEVDLLKPISFDKVFQLDKFNSLCKGFIQLSCYSEVSNVTDIIELQKGSGRRWTKEKDLEQLRMFSKSPYDQKQIIRIAGKNPFLWHDHWPVKDYAKVFQCLALVDEISREADKVVARIREIGFQESKKTRSSKNGISLSQQQVSYVSVHMRIEKDWMIHCEKREQRSNISQICSSKEQIMQRVGNIVGLEDKTPIVVYLAVADDLLEDNSVLTGWKEGLLPFEKKSLGVIDIYKKHPYLIQSAIDYEVCLRSDVFVGNSFSTFSSLIVLDRTKKMLATGGSKLCGTEARWPSYAYNIGGDSNGPHPWATNMSDLSLQAISYGTNHISCG